MILTRLTLENYGVFGGSHELELAPEQHRPIILFGGKNGAGKTTILEAVRLCLYGRRALGTRVREFDYESFLDARIHRALGAPKPFSASVGLDFTYVQAGRLANYTVIRRWKRRGVRIAEQLELKRDGAPLTEIDHHHWDDFVKDLVPPGVSQLFFFDGEKIQALAENEPGDLDLASSIKGLLSIDLVERLQADLSVYLTRQSNARQTKKLRSEIADLEKEMSRLEDQLSAAGEALRASTKAVHAQRRRLTRAEDKLASVGGTFARDRARLQEERGRLDGELAATEAQIRSLCEGLLPFAVAPELLQAVARRVEAERERGRIRAMRELLNERLGRVRAALLAELADHALLPARAQKALAKRLEAVIRTTLSPGACESNEVAVHDLSDANGRRLLTWVVEARNSVPRLVSEIAVNLERLSREQADVEQKLNNVPPDEILRPMLERINAHHSHLGRLESERERLAEQERQFTRELQRLAREIEKRRVRIQEEEATSARMSLIAGTQVALERFEKQIVRSKIDQLTREFTACFNRLARKSEFVKRVEIDPATYEVTLFGKQGIGIPKEALSAGERQIYAIAMLWALARTSRRPLPLIIDTPLGRLDSDHRRNLISNYFPHAAQQVIVLSTDTEIDKPYFEDLEPYVARSYRLEFDQRDQITRCEAGYFWRSNEKGHDDSRAQQLEPATA